MKKIITYIMTLFRFGAASSAESVQTTSLNTINKKYPPVPLWRPEFRSSDNEIIDRMKYYTDGTKDFVILQNGTIVVLDDGLSDGMAIESAKKVLSDIYNYHPDMNPVNMDDGNILVRYNHPAFNIVINDFANSHLDKIRQHHLDALAADEVLMTPMGPNKFDEFGMKALYGRCFMFMDAQNPVIVKIYRKSAQQGVAPEPVTHQ